MPSFLGFYRFRDLKYSELRNAIEEACLEELDEDPMLMVAFPEGDRNLKLSALNNVISLADVEFTVSASNSRRRSDTRVIYIHCKGYSSCFGLQSTDTIGAATIERIVSTLKLETATDSDRPVTEAERIAELKSRVRQLEEVLHKRSPKLRAFLSFKFDNDQVLKEVARLKRLLEQIDVEWASAEQYEPRKIEEKVKAKLRADITLVITVISRVGQSMWLRDEIADANARNLPVIVLVERGAEFEAGIFGNLEYIEFSDRIDETFLGVIEGVRFIKEEVISKQEKPDLP